MLGILYALVRYVVHKYSYFKLKTDILDKMEKNSAALVRERTIPTERPPPVGEVRANFYG